MHAHGTHNGCKFCWQTSMTSEIPGHPSAQQWVAWPLHEEYVSHRCFDCVIPIAEHCVKACGEKGVKRRALAAPD